MGYRVLALFEAVDNISRVAAQIGGNVEGLHTRVMNVGRAMTTAGATLTAGLTVPILGLGGAILKMSSDFETAMTVAQTMTGSTAEQFDLYQEKVRELMTFLPQSGQDLAEALYFIASAGFRGQEAIDILTSSGKAAANALADIETVAQSVTSVISSYGLAGEDAAWITDVLTMGVIEGTAEFEDLAGAIGRVLPFSAAAGVSFQEVMASLATMTRAGLNADEATTALRAALSNLFAPTKEAQKAMAELGLSADQVRDAIREKGLLVTLGMLMEKTGGNVETLDRLFGNVRGLIGVLATAGTQAEAYKDILDKVNNSMGVTDEAFERTSETARVQFALVRNALTQVAYNIGDVLLPMAKEWSAHLLVWTERLKEVSPQTLELVLKIAALVAVIGPALTLLGALTMGIGALISPVGQTIAVLALLGTAIATNFGGLRDILGPLFSWLSKSFSDFVQDLRTNSPAEVLQEWVPRIVPMLRTMVEYILRHTREGTTGIISAVEEWAKALRDWAAPLAGIVSRQLGSLVKDITTWIVANGPRIAEAAGRWAVEFLVWLVGIDLKIVSGLVTLLGKIVSWIISKAPDIADALKTWAQEWVDYLEPYIPGIQAAVVSVSDRVTGWIRDRAGEIAAALKTWAQEWVGFLKPKLPEIPGKIREFVEKIADAIVTYTPRVVQSLMELSTKFITWLTPRIPDILNALTRLWVDVSMNILVGIPKIVGALAKLAWEFIQWPPTQELLNAMGGLLLALYNWITKDAWNSIVEAVKPWVDAFLSWVVDLVPKTPEEMQKIEDAIITWVGDRLQSIADQGKKIGDAILKGIGDGAEAAIGWLKSKIDEIIAKLPQWVRDMLGIHSPSTVFIQIGQEVIAGLVVGMDSEQLAVVQKITEIVNGIVGNISSIIETLGTKLPEPQTTMTELLDRAFGITKEVADFYLAENVKEYTNWFDKSFRGNLGQWKDSLAPVVEILESTMRILEILATKVADTKTSVGIFLGRTLDLMEQVEDWFTKHGGRLAIVLYDFAENIAPTLADWNTALEPLGGLLGTSRDLLDAASEQAVYVDDSVQKLLDALLQIMWDVREWFDANRTTFYLTLVDDWKTVVKPALEELNEVLEPLRPLLETVNSVAAATSEQAGYADEAVKTLLDDLLILMWDVREWFDANRTWFYETLVDDWKTVVGPALTNLNTAIAPLSGLLETARGILETTAASVPEVGTQVDLFFNNLLVIMQQVADYINFANAEGLLTAFIDGFTETVKPVLEALNVALEDLAPLLDTAKGILETTAAKVPEVGTQVDLFFNNLLVIMQQVADYINWADSEGLLSAFIDGFTKTVKPVLEALNVALEDLAPLLDTSQGMLETTAASVPEVGTQVDLFFNNLLVLMAQVADYINFANAEGLLMAFIAGFTETVKPVLEALNVALEDLAPLLDTSKGILETTAAAVPEVGIQVDLFFNNLLVIMGQVADYINWANAEGLLMAFVSGFTETVKPVLEALNVALEDLAPLLDTSKGILETTAEKVPEVGIQVDLFFNNLLVIMQQVAEYINFANAEGLLMAFIAGFTETVKPVLEAWNLAMSDLGPLLSTAKSILETTAEDAGEVNLDVQGALGALKQIMDTVRTWVESQGTVLTDAIAAFEETAKPVLSAWNTAVSDLGPLLSTAKEILDLTTEDVGDVNLDVTELFDALLVLMGTVQTWINTNRSSLEGMIAAFAGTEEQKGIASYLTEWKDALTPLGELLGKGEEVLGSLETDAGDVTTSTNNFLTALYNVAGAVNTWLAEHPTFESDLMALVNVIGPKITAFKDKVVEMGGFFDLATSAVNDMNTDAGDLLTAVNAFLATLAGYPTGASEPAGGWLGGIRTSLEQALNGIGSVITAARDTLPGQLDSLLADLVNSATVPSARWIGQSIIQGVIAGLYSQQAALTGALQDVLRTAQEGAQTVIDAHSPSRVYMGLGRDIASGLALGITQGTGDVVAAMGGLVSGLDYSANTRAPVLATRAQPEATVRNETHLHVGVLVADEAGLRELERRLRPVREQEDIRRGRG